MTVRTDLIVRQDPDNLGTGPTSAKTDPSDCQATEDPGTSWMMMRADLTDHLDPDDPETRTRAVVIEQGGQGDQVHQPTHLLHPTRLGQGLAAFPGSRWPNTVNQEQTAIARLMRFGTTEASRLTRDNLNSASVATFISSIHNLIRNNAFDDSVMQILIGRATIRLLGFYFTPSETARRNPIENHWTTDWDVATIIQALEEHYPLRPEGRHLATSFRWQQVVIESRKKARIQIQDMDMARRDTINEWSSTEERIGTATTMRSSRTYPDASPARTIQLGRASRTSSSSATSMP